MANDAINPYQLFRDDDGIPVASGKLKVLVNLTSQVGTAFSDSALQVPQVVDPYTLDNYGRITGDLRWSGLRSLELRSANDEFIRRYDNAVTVIDSAGFPKVYDSVAAMAADTTLEDGDVAETVSYNAGQRQGGARYSITTSAETVDNFLVIDLAPAGLQARLLDVERRKNFYCAGAIGDGATDDSVPVQAVLDTNGNIECANGTFLCSDLSLNDDTRLYGDGTLISPNFVTTDLLTLIGTDKQITFDGITFDGNEANQIAEAAQSTVVIGLAATANGGSYVTFNNVTFQNGNKADVSAAADDDGRINQISFSQCRFLGGKESTTTPYVTSSVIGSDGMDMLFEDCYFDLLATPQTTGGRNGIVSTGASALSNPGFLTVSACTLNRMGASVNIANSLAAIHATRTAEILVNDSRILSPQWGGVVVAAEVSSVQVKDNYFEGLTGDFIHGVTGAITSGDATPGDNWQIDGNVISSPGGVAIVVDGSTMGANVSNMQISRNMIDSPATGVAQLIQVENLDDLEIVDNFLDLSLEAGVDGIVIDAAGVSGTVKIAGNSVINGSATSDAIVATTTSTAAYVIDGNTLETGQDAINVRNSDSARITNNHMIDFSGDLLAVEGLTTAIITGNSYTGTTPATFAENVGTVTSLLMGQNSWEQVDGSIRNIVPAATINVTSHYHVMNGTAAITSGTFVPDIEGFMVTFMGNAGVATFNDGAGANGFNLGAASRALSSGDTLTVIWQGNLWVEVAFSNN